MTMHECLHFIDALHGFIATNSDNPNSQACWPTRELAAYNLRRNKHMFPSDRELQHSFGKQVSIAKGRHWMTDEGCSSHCHARHLALTAAGREALRLMKEQGCGRRCHEHRETKLRLERRIAA